MKTKIKRKSIGLMLLLLNEKNKFKDSTQMRGGKKIHLKKQVQPNELGKKENLSIE